MQILPKNDFHLINLMKFFKPNSNLLWRWHEIRSLSAAPHLVWVQVLLRYPSTSGWVKKTKAIRCSWRWVRDQQTPPWTDLSVDPVLNLFLFVLQAGVGQEVLVLKNRAFKTPSKEETSGTGGTSIKEWESHWTTRTWTTGETKATILSQGWKHEKKVFVFVK